MLSLSSIIYLIWYFKWQFLLNEITNHCFRIATTKSGCCVIQSCVENCRGEARNRNRLIDDIIENVVHLAEDPYGYECFLTNSVCFIELISACFIESYPSLH